MLMIWLKENSIIVVFCNASCLGKYAHSSFFQSYILTFSCISFNLVWLFVSFFFFYLCFHLLVVHKTLSKAKVSANWKNDLVEAHLGTQASISRSNAQMNKYFVFFFSFRKRFSSCYNTSTANL